LALGLIFSLSVNHRQWNCRIWCVEFSYRSLGTVDNHGNTEITETVISVKCPECRDFTFSQEFFVFDKLNLEFIV